MLTDLKTRTIFWKNGILRVNHTDDVLLNFLNNMKPFTYMHVPKVMKLMIKHLVNILNFRRDTINTQSNNYKQWIDIDNTCAIMYDGDSNYLRNWYPYRKLLFEKQTTPVKFVSDRNYNCIKSINIS